ncbi:hypothetical protein [Treponema putidum]|uniref:Uncharacterized protein n=1 Tax=Treponema putidum TaxID=221027 RepID=A0AAE9MSP1_9SPIR|nr:hypothetical protein [Treponema putidum]AIN92774.1 hypothetical protein JO40_00380 [Treponema putidum]TWI75218.1 hypothetical protein JM98_01982 [Treponema putidum]UTY29018.1 hypothetical protein E4N76_08490 [Treponema putidum]UTY33869.1 hypothetical protein E4N74_07515 [Treponema putidum]
MEINDFINTIGYDGNSAIVDKARLSKNSNKDIDKLLESGAFRAAAAYAVYTESDEDLQKVADEYNKLSNSNYKKEQIKRLFGVSKVEVKRKLVW